MCRRILISLLTLCTLLAVNTAVFAQDPPAQPYKDIKPIQPTQVAEGKIEVVEVFWYGCPHCYDFEPQLSKWVEKLPADVEFRRMPAVYNNSLVPHARAYYTAEKMGIVEQIHRPLFDAMHKEKKQINNEKALQEFFVDHGADEAEFKRIYNSMEIDTMVKQALVMGVRYRIEGVPAVVINGKYLTSGKHAGSYENLLKVMDQLVDKEREELTRQ